MPLLDYPDSTCPHLDDWRQPISQYVHVVRNINELENHRGAWEDLASAAIEPNVFYEPWMLMPALRSFAKDEPLIFALVYARSKEPNNKPLLCGFFPFHRVPHFRQTPFNAFRLWTHLHCFLHTPLIRKGYEDPCLSALFSWIGSNPHLPQLIEFAQVAGDGPFWRCLQRHLSESGHSWIETESHKRAFLTNPHDGEEYLKQALSTGNRKELRRQRRRLGEHGELVCQRLTDAADLDNWLREFLNLELQSWKGRQKTALMQSAIQEKYFRTICRQAFQRDQLIMLKLSLSGKPIAMKCSFVSKEGLFAFKIAYDESLAKHSPGVQLELDNIRCVCTRPDVQWMDSCAVEDHSMINRLWNERRSIRSAVACTGGVAAQMFVKCLPWLQRFRRRFLKKRPEHHS